jgi:DNA polymerase elongation subunit (family B)
MYDNHLIFGKDETNNIVSCEVDECSVELFIEKDGLVTTKIIPNSYWILSHLRPDSSWLKLEGNLHYKYFKKVQSKDEFNIYKNKYDTYVVWDDKESSMLLNGFTYFKGMKINDVSILSFDIETTGLYHNDSSKVLLISNTYRSINGIERKLFCYDDYESEADLFDDWCNWVREKDPSIICGHNIYSYDLKYLDFCAKKAGTSIVLGRNRTELKINKKQSNFRIDGAKELQYNKIHIYGREIVDTMFLSYRYDIGRKYESYGLKNIIKQEGLEAKDRQFYDASLIRFKYQNSEEWEKIKQYCIHDSDDALKLFDLMIPAYFYLTQSVPKSFQSIMTGASGSQLNSFLVRSYLQNGHSIPKSSELKGFEGAISIGNPGIYKNVTKVDVASLYPSIILQYEIYDKQKDPNAHFQKMVEYFTHERLINKKKAKETSDKYYKDLEQAMKIFINSSYGLLGAPGLNFNSPFNGSLVTRKGREILQISIDWALENEFTLVNADTDSISITYKNKPLDEEERQQILDILNGIMPEKIRFEDDGYYETVVVVKAKNYVLKPAGSDKIKIKGSGLKVTMKETALKRFMEEVIYKLISDKRDEVINVYHDYVKKIYNITDITDWCSKKNITESVLNPERTNEQSVLDAIEGTEYVQGDKIYVYFQPEYKDENGKKVRKLKLREHWNQDHCPITLLDKLHSTLITFETVLDISQFPNYALKRNENLGRELAGLQPIPKKTKIVNN